MPITNLKFAAAAAVPEPVAQRLRVVGSGDLTWEVWQCQVVDLLRSDSVRELQVTTLDDVEWHAWQPYFNQGKSPRQAIEQALERVL